MKVCVTGAGGFIGKHVCRALSEAGHEVLGLDLGWEPGVFSFMATKADITQPLACISDLDAVIHLAAVASPRECDRDPAKAYRVNVHGTHQVLKMVLESKAKKVVFASSAHVYGIPPERLPTDEDSPLALSNTYTMTKILGEQLCGLYHERHGLSIIVLRLFNAYGPGQSTGYFVPDMLENVRHGDLGIHGGNTTKDFVYVNDVARAFVLALETSFVGPINIGTGKETDLAEVAGFIARASGREFANLLDSFPTRMQADISQAKHVLGWVPTTTIEEGLRACLNSAAIPA